MVMASRTSHLNSSVGVDVAEEVEQPRQQRAIPLRALPGREALLAEVPLLRRPSSTACGLRCRRQWSAAWPLNDFHRPLRNSRNAGRVDLRLLVNDDDDLLSRPAQFADLDAVAVARVAFEPRRVAERLEAELRCELILLERPARQAEHELEVRLVAR